VIRAQRLTGRKRFSAVRAAGASARGTWVKVRAIRSQDELSRAGIAVRGSKAAVLRNRARRRLRAALGPVLQRHPGLDVFVAASATDVTGAPFHTLESDLDAALSAAAARL